MKRKCVQQVTTATKNLRSKIPSRKRSHISPIILDFSTSKPSHSLRHLNSTSNCDEVSCNTTLESAVLPPNAAVRVRKDDVVGKQQQVSVSENYSCVESCSVVAADGEFNNRNDAVSFSVAQHSPTNTTATVEQKTADIFSGGSGGYCVTGDLACDESLSYDDNEVTSAAETFSELQSEISSSNNGIGGCSQFDDFIDEYTPSIWQDSGSDFSEKSCGDDAAPSPCFSLFKAFKQQFLILNSPFPDHHDDSSFTNGHSIEEISYWRFEDEEDEESYRLLRSRERNPAAKVKDYVEEYDYESVFGVLIADQRLLMADWIVQISHKQDLRSETMFLGVRLFDRVLSKGCFTSRRNLQILGIACLTLAIRIEENQPYNSVRQKCFYVERNNYSRTEVVAMEWVVQEVLEFHCISTTVYNFLWFYLKAAGANEQMQRKAEDLASLTLLDHMQLRFWPSSVAAAIVFLVSLSLEREESCQRVMEVHVRTKIDDLSDCIKSLEWLVNRRLQTYH